MTTSEKILAWLLSISITVIISVGTVNYHLVTKIEDRYADALVVVETYNNLIIARDYQGNMFSFTSDEDLQPNHIVAVMIDGKGTPEVEDDEIVNAVFAGCVQN